jgi:YqjK-like protein
LIAGTREELLLHRERLRARSQQLREQWSLQVQPIRVPLGVADRARDAVKWLVRNPEWPIGAALLLLVLRPGRALRWAGLAWQGWAVYQRLNRVLGPQGLRRR